MVAGWDNLLPGWFSRLHATYRTPVNSILFLGGVTLAASLGVLIGVGQQEAFTSLQIWGFTFYGLAYLALFAVPLLAKKETKLRPGLWLQAAAISGFAVTLLFVLSSAFPIIPVVSQSAYTAKTIAVVLGANIVGIAVYYWGRRRQLVRS
jgi:amino acid transporter